MKLPVFAISIRPRRPGTAPRRLEGNNRPETAFTQTTNESEISAITEHVESRPTSSASNNSRGASTGQPVSQVGMAVGRPGMLDTSMRSISSASSPSITGGRRRAASQRLSSPLQQLGLGLGNPFQNPRFSGVGEGAESPRRRFGVTRSMSGRNFMKRDNKATSFFRSKGTISTPQTNEITSPVLLPEIDNLSNCNSSDDSSTLPTHAISISPSSVLQFTLPQDQSPHQSHILTTTRCFCTLRLRHTGHTKSYMAYKVKTTQPKRYRVQPNHCGILSPGMSTTVTIRLLEKYKRTLVQGHRIGEDGVAVTSEEDNFFVQSCIVDDALARGMVGDGDGVGGDKLPTEPQSTSKAKSGKAPGTKPVSDERMAIIWKNAKNNPDTVKVYKRKLLVKHIYPGVVDVLETTPADTLEFVLPYDPEEFSTSSSNDVAMLKSPVSIECQGSLCNHTISEDEGDAHRIIDPYNDDEASQSNKIPRCFLTLTHTNETFEHVLFKVKTNRPKRYRVHPDHQGLLSPGDSKMVGIRLLEKHRTSLLRGFDSKRRQVGGSTSSLPPLLPFTTTQIMKEVDEPRREELKTEDRFFIQYCTVDDVFLREWPNLNSAGMTMPEDEGGEEGTESGRSECHKKIAGAMSGMWAAAERSKSVHVMQRRYPVRHMVELDENYVNGSSKRLGLVSGDESAGMTEEETEEEEILELDGVSMLESIKMGL